MLLATAVNPFGANLFAYCYNNPVMYTDPTGYSPKILIFITKGIKALLAALGVGLTIAN